MNFKMEEEDEPRTNSILSFNTWTLSIMIREWMPGTPVESLSMPSIWAKLRRWGGRKVTYSRTWILKLGLPLGQRGTRCPPSPTSHRWIIHTNLLAQHHTRSYIVLLLRFMAVNCTPLRWMPEANKLEDIRKFLMKGTQYLYYGLEGNQLYEDAWTFEKGQKIQLLLSTIICPTSIRRK
jgi:hypothetical protein